MKKINTTIVAGSLIASTQAALANTEIIAAKELSRFGINPDVITNKFLLQQNLTITPDQLLKVSPENEGKNLRFETLDSISVTVPIQHAAGSLNKGGI